MRGGLYVEGVKKTIADPLHPVDKAELLDALGRAIVALGVEVFLTRPVILPNETHFPDTWEPTALGVARIIRRMMRRRTYSRPVFSGNTPSAIRNAVARA